MSSNMLGGKIKANDGRMQITWFTASLRPLPSLMIYMGMSAVKFLVASLPNPFVYSTLKTILEGQFLCMNDAPSVLGQ